MTVSGIVSVLDHPCAMSLSVKLSGYIELGEEKIA